MVSVGLTSQHRPKKIRFGAHSLRQRASEHGTVDPPDAESGALLCNEDRAARVSSGRSRETPSR